jgi:hypothetical protein
LLYFFPGNEDSQLFLSFKTPKKNFVSLRFAISLHHRWVHLLKHQLSITISCLPTKENQHSFSISSFSKQIEVYHFPRFSLTENKRKLPFSVSSVFYLQNSKNMETWTEVGNMTSKCNGFTHYPLCHVLRVITFRSDNSANLDRVITLRRKTTPMYQEQ